MQPAGPASDVHASTTRIEPRSSARVLRGHTPGQWYASLIGAFLAVRGTSTLIAGASFASPGDGWRAAFQLSVACLLFASVRTRARAGRTVLGVGVLYLIVTALGLINGHDILSIIPVDARDKVVHPLLALTALVVGLRERRRATTSGRTVSG